MTFVFPRRSMFSEAKPRRTLIQVEGKQHSLFPEGPVIKCFVIPPDSNTEQNPGKMICMRPTKAVLTERAAVKPIFAANKKQMLNFKILGLI